MLTKVQKKEQVATSKKQVEASKTLVFADFSGVSILAINKLKKSLKEKGATFRVFKKNLLNIAFKDAGVDFDLTQFKAPIGTVFAQGDLSSVAGTIYKFIKELEKQKIPFKVVGGFDRDGKKAISNEEFMVIAKLPSREELLGMVLGGMTGPLRAFMHIVSELSKKAPAAPETKPEPVAPQAVTEKPAAEVPATPAAAATPGPEVKA